MDKTKSYYVRKRPQISDYHVNPFKTIETALNDPFLTHGVFRLFVYLVMKHDFTKFKSYKELNNETELGHRQQVSRNVNTLIENNYLIKNN